MSWTLIKGVNIGEIPPTPTSLEEIPELPHAYKELKKIAYRHGLPTAYKQEQSGRLVQHIFPIQKTESTQISSSSKIDLELHTETAFHVYSPSHVLLMCLREDLKHRYNICNRRRHCFISRRRNNLLLKRTVVRYSN